MGPRLALETSELLAAEEMQDLELDQVGFRGNKLNKMKKKKSKYIYIYLYLYTYVYISGVLLLCP